METYNQKRKLNNQKRKNKPLLYSDIMLELLASGLSKKQATKKAKDIIQRETLERLNNKKVNLWLKYHFHPNIELFVMRKRLSLILGT